MPSQGQGNGARLHRGGIPSGDIDKPSTRVGASHASENFHSQYGAFSQPDESSTKSVWKSLSMDKVRMEPTEEDLNFPGQLHPKFGEKWVPPIGPLEVPLDNMPTLASKRASRESGMKLAGGQKTVDADSKPASSDQEKKDGADQEVITPIFQEPEASETPMQAEAGDSIMDSPASDEAPATEEPVNGDVPDLPTAHEEQKSVPVESEPESVEREPDPSPKSFWTTIQEESRDNGSSGYGYPSPEEENTMMGKTSRRKRLWKKFLGFLGGLALLSVKLFFLVGSIMLVGYNLASMIQRFFLNHTESVGFLIFALLVYIGLRLQDDENSRDSVWYPIVSFIGLCLIADGIAMFVVLTWQSHWSGSLVFLGQS